MKKSFVYLLSLGLLLLSCEDFLKREIHIDQADKDPKVCVTSLLEDSLFYIYLSLSNPINAGTFKKEKVNKALVQVFEEDKLILEITEHDDYTDYPQFVPEEYDLPFALRESVRVHPGKTYSLRVEVEGYAPVSASMQAPEQLATCQADLLSTKEVRYDDEEVSFYVGDYYSLCATFLPWQLHLKDPENGKNFYMLEAREVVNNNTSPASIYLRSSQALTVGTADRMLVQDNPDTEGDLWESDAQVKLFMFGQMLFSNLSFQGKEQTFPLQLSSCQLEFKDNSCHYLQQFYPPERIYTSTHRIYVILRQIDEQSFNYYRTFVIQKKGVDFFSEPVNLYSNITGGYGCFSVCSTTRLVLKEYTKCYISW